MDDVTERGLRSLILQQDKELAELTEAEEEQHSIKIWVLDACARKDRAWIRTEVSASSLSDKIKADLLDYIDNAAG